MQTQRSTLLNIANELYKQGKRILRKIIDTDYRPFADGEFVLSIFMCLPISHLNGRNLFSYNSSLKLAELTARFLDL